MKLVEIQVGFLFVLTCIQHTHSSSYPLAYVCMHVCTQVESVAGLRHPHVVCLYGYCMEVPEGTEMTEQVLVFEYMPNGDMTKLLENRECRNSWLVSLHS